MHVKSTSFSTDNSRTSRLSIFYRISNHKNFFPKYPDNARLNFTNIEAAIVGKGSSKRFIIIVVKQKNKKYFNQFNRSEPFNLDGLISSVGNFPCQSKTSQGVERNEMRLYSQARRGFSFERTKKYLL